MSIRCGFRRVPAISQARSFFSLPDLLGGGSSKSGEEQTYREQKILPYTQEQLYSIVSNVPSYKSFLPFCTSSTIVDGERPQLDEPFEIEAELKVGFMSFEESYVSRVSGEPFRSVKAVASETPLFKTLETTWTFHPPARLSHQSSSSPASQSIPTMVTLDLRYSFNNASHNSVSSMFFGGVSGMMVAAFEKRCRDLYGPK